MNEEEIQNIQRILTEHFQRQSKSKDEVEQALSAVAAAIQQEGDKLVYTGITGEVVFLVSIRGKNVVEFHGMVGGDPSEKEKLSLLKQELPAFLDKLKNLGVYVAYVSSPIKKFGPFEQLLNSFGFKVSEKFDDDGTTVIAYYKVLVDGT